MPSDPGSSIERDLIDIIAAAIHQDRQTAIHLGIEPEASEYHIAVIALRALTRAGKMALISMDADLDALSELARKATPGPWGATDGEDSWDLYGALAPNAHGHKILKAPKHGTPYAEYWPNDADAAYIEAVDPSTVLALLTRLERLRCDLEAWENKHPLIVENERLRTAARTLLALKDGPKDSPYYARKQDAWDALRTALGGAQS